MRKTLRLTVKRPGVAMLRDIDRRAGARARGKVAAIDVESGEFFLGDTVLDAAILGRAELRDPKHLFYFVRIGTGPVSRQHGGIRRK